MTAPRMGPRDRVHVHDLIDPTLLAEMVEERQVTERHLFDRSWQAVQFAGDFKAES